MLINSTKDTLNMLQEDDEPVAMDADDRPRDALGDDDERVRVAILRNVTNFRLYCNKFCLHVLAS